MVPSPSASPKGRYDLYPDQAPERELYVSNTAGTNSSVKDKKIGILVEDMQDVTIDGDGSELVFHGKMTEFAAINSENITFKNYSTDFEVPTVIDVTVEETDATPPSSMFPNATITRFQELPLPGCLMYLPIRGRDTGRPPTDWAIPRPMTKRPV